MDWNGSLVPRPSTPPAFDRFQYAKTEKLEVWKAWERGYWNGGINYGILCTPEGTISHCVPASFIPFHSVRPPKVSSIPGKATS